MRKYYLAVDIGASSGRHILGSLENGKIVLEEVHRFENGMEKKNGRLCWNTERLFSEIVAGMKKCGELGKAPASMGIDTWGVDYVLLDGDGRDLGDAVGYRDKRTNDMDLAVEKYLSLEQLYARTGIPKQSYNTIYQLMAMKEYEPELLRNAKAMLMTPDYYQYRLTGKTAQEFTMATTTALVSAATGDWDRELIRMLGLPENIFLPISHPGTFVGSLRPEIIAEVGYDCDVVMVPSHDTASAVLAIPAADEDALFISSGTWSMVGIESPKANCTPDSLRAGFTNEGSYGSSFYYVKNIMGLWLIQSIKKELGGGKSYDEISDLASRETITSTVDCTDNIFLAPESMAEAVREVCRRTGQQVPETLGQIACVIYNSLARSYRDTIAEIRELSGKTYGDINIIGGGSRDKYLNGLTAKYTGRKVIAGPTEATALGNIVSQMLKDGLFAGKNEARACVADSFAVQSYR